MKKGFTLIEMLVVIGIIAVLVGASIGGFSAMTKSAENTKCQELVSNTATALTAMFQDTGVWPQRLANQGMAVIIISDDLPEVLENCSDLLVMKKDKIVAHLDPATTDESVVLSHMM
jgi:prepilin-type N-terminal cleavage/methylation domain-containing protein